jgi:hypothetical protein
LSLKKTLRKSENTKKNTESCSKLDVYHHFKVAELKTELEKCGISFSAKDRRHDLLEKLISIPFKQRNSSQAADVNRNTKVAMVAQDLTVEEVLTSGSSFTQQNSLSILKTTSCNRPVNHDSDTTMTTGKSRTIIQGKNQYKLNTKIIHSVQYYRVLIAYTDK